MQAKITKIVAKMGHFDPNSGKKLGNLYKKYQNLRKFVKLGCPDPTPAAYIVNTDSFGLYQRDFEVRPVDEFSLGAYGQYFFCLPPDPSKATLKITGL